MIGWLASPDEDAFIHVSIPKINFSLGEKVPLEVTVLDRMYSPAKKAMVNGTITNETGLSRQLDFIPVPGEPATWQTSYLPPEAGKYHLNITGIRSEDDKSVISTDIIVHAATQEFKFLSADWKFLRSLARESGGKFYTLDQFSRYMDSIKPEKIKNSKIITRLMIDYPYILILIITLATLEWVLRIRGGLS
jgi:hypothetical protein